MNLHPDAIAVLAQLERSGPVGSVQVPVAAFRSAGQWTLAGDSEAALEALGERLIGCETQVELEHDVTLRAGFRLIG
jgi:hypothetical protein